MQQTQPSDPKLLFVVSNDFGELANALYLLRGYPFRATLLLPERLFATNRDRLTASVVMYRSVADVLTAARDLQPDVVFLFSAYLYALNGNLPLEGVAELVSALGRENVPLVTSDPFLGVLARLDGSTFSDRHPFRQVLLEHFARLCPILRHMIHLYLVDPGPAPPGPSVSFFNPHILSVSAMPVADPFWLFVLAQEDYTLQVARLGRQRFEQLLLERLNETAKARRRPVLIAPDPLIGALAGHGAEKIGGLRLLSFCSYSEFMSLLLQAEYCFYWNLYTNSVPARVVNQMPVFFFASGHMVEAIPPLAAAAAQRYYAGALVPLLDLGQPLDASTLAPLAAAQPELFGVSRAQFQQSPPPDAMVASILARGPSCGSAEVAS
jgi:hypothetical protein